MIAGATRYLVVTERKELTHIAADLCYDDLFSTIIYWQKKDFGKSRFLWEKKKWKENINVKLGLF